jgi:hypothetical protein
MISLTLVGKEGTLRPSFHYFWGKWVQGFDPTEHCARCLLGDFEKAISPAWKTGDELEIACKPGEILYVCGVAEPYNWSKNFHLPLRIGQGQFTKQLSNSMLIRVSGATEILFDALSARELYPRKDHRFLSCRNFQFGAHQFGFVPPPISASRSRSAHRFG